MKKGESVKIKRRRKFPVFLVIILLLLIAIIVIVLKIKKRQSEKIPHEELNPTAIATAKEYVEEKYGDVLTYSDMNKGNTSMMFGELIWKVAFKDESGQSYEIWVMHDSKNNCMYIDRDYYYSYYIEERMTEWMELQLKETDLSEYLLEYVPRYFSPEWSADYDVEQILQELQNETKTGYKGYISFIIRIPERERGIYDSGKLADDLNKLLKGKKAILIELIIYPDEVFDHYQEAPDSNRFNDIERMYIWESDGRDVNCNKDVT